MKYFLLGILGLGAISMQGQFSWSELNLPAEVSIIDLNVAENGDVYFFSPRNDSTIFFSNDGGTTWMEEDLNRALHFIPFLALKDMYFYSDHTALLFSQGQYENGAFSLQIRDGANDWREITQFNSIQGIGFNNDVLYVVTDFKIYSSADKGQSFQEEFDLSFLTEEVRIIVKNDKFFVINRQWNGPQVDEYKMYVYDKDGNLLSPFGIELPNNYRRDQIWITDCEEILIVDGDDCRYSNDLGVTFSREFFPDSVFIRHFGKIADEIVGFSETGIYTRPDCGFQDTVSSVPPVEIYSRWQKHPVFGDIKNLRGFQKLQNGHLFAYVWMNDFYIHSTDNGQNWTEKKPDVNLASYRGINAVHDYTIFQTGSENYYESYDDGATWDFLFDFPNFFYDNWELASTGRSYFWHKRDKKLYYKEAGSSDLINIDYTASATMSIYLNLKLLSDDVLLLGGNASSFYLSIDAGNTFVKYDLDIPTHYTIPTKFSLIGDQLYVLTKGDFPNFDDFKLGILDINTGTSNFHSWSAEKTFDEFEIANDGTIYFIKTIDQPSLGDDYLFKTEDFGVSCELVSSTKIPSSNVDLIPGPAGSIFLKSSNAGLQVLEDFTFSNIDYPPINQGNFFIFEFLQNNKAVLVHNEGQVFLSDGSFVFDFLVQGNIFLDKNNNCVQDPGENNFEDWFVEIIGNGFYKSQNSNAAGDFSFSAVEGEYTLNSKLPNEFYGLCQDNLNLNLTAPNYVENVDIPIQILQDCPKFQISGGTAILRPCRELTYTYSLLNEGPSTADQANLEIILDPDLEFIELTGDYESYTLQGDSMVIVEFGAMILGESNTLRLRSQVACTVNMGDVLCVKATASAANACATSNAESLACLEAITSWDPNDKKAYSDDGLPISSIYNEEFINYHIRFQNIGTDTAFNIRIEDVISADLNIRTLELLGASHDFDFLVTDESKLIFKFSNINLPDSLTNEPASHGFVKFRIQPINGLGLGTTIRNEASIFFDFNEAVITNVSEVAIDEAVSIPKGPAVPSFKMFPNPGNGSIHFIPNNNLNEEELSLSITDIFGRRLIENAPFSFESSLLENYKPGLYLITLKSAHKTIWSGKYVRL